RFELVVNSSPRLDAYDAATGAPLWHADEFPCRAPVPTPVLAGGVIYASRGFNSGPYMAPRPGGRGDVRQGPVLCRGSPGRPRRPRAGPDGRAVRFVTPLLPGLALPRDRNWDRPVRRPRHGRDALDGAGGRRVLGLAARRRGPGLSTERGGRDARARGRAQ